VEDSGSRGDGQESDTGLRLVLWKIQYAIQLRVPIRGLSLDQVPL